MTALPEPESPDDLYDPNEAARKRQRALWLGAAAVLSVLGLVYIWMQLNPGPDRALEETRRRMLATAEIARRPDRPEVVNGDLKRQVQQLQQQNTDLQTQNLQLADAAKQAEGARNSERADAMRAISALEDEVNRKRGELAGPPAARASLPGAPAAPPPPGLAQNPLAAAAGDPKVTDHPGLARVEPEPRRVMTVIRSPDPGSLQASEPTGRTGGAPPAATPTDFANAPHPPVTDRAPPGAGKTNAAYFTSRLEIYPTAEFVPPNAYAAAEVLVGVDSATSVSSAADPKPVLLRLTGDAVSVGADGRYQRTRLKGCLVNGAAYGELSSEKIYVKLQRITCPAGSGQFSVATVEGYVSQRGKAGVRGLVVERAGGLTARAAVAGTLQGLGSTLSQNLSRSAGGVTTVAGPGGVLATEKLTATELAQGAVGGGVANAASQLAEYYIKRAEQYQPVIEMPTGIAVEIVFLSGFQLRSAT